MRNIIFQNGWFLTPAGDFEKATLVVSDNRIEDFIDDDASPSGGLSDDTEFIDLDGAYVIPGFVDTHIHLTALGLNTLRCDLSEATSAREVCEKLSDWAATHDDPFIIGVGFDESRWEHAAIPTRVMLDGVDDSRPVLARRVCTHLGVANTPLLDRLKKRPDLGDEETGVVCENVLWEAGRLWSPDPEQVVAGIETAIRQLHSLGITTIHDIADPQRFEQYVKGISQSSVPIRIDMLLQTNPRHLEYYKTQCAESDARDLRVTGLKCFLDGSLGGRTAALNADYADGDGWGNLLLRKEVIQALTEECSENGYVLSIHAIGDRAIDQAAGVLKTFSKDSELFRMEHCEVAAPTQIENLKSAPVFLSLQPNFVRNWGGAGGLNERRLGKDRNRWCNPFRSLHDSGLTCVFGSDGMPAGPLYGIKGAIQHPVSEERLSPEEAVAGYTSRPHSLAAHKRDAGILEPGQLADLVVLSKNPFTEDPDTIDVLKTVVDGEIVFDSGATD